MKLQIPEPDWHTIKLLAKRWETYESHIEQLIEEGKLRAEVNEGSGRAGHDPESTLEWERCNRLIPHPSKWHGLPGGLSWPFGSRIIIRREEIERIEGNGQSAATSPTTNSHYRIKPEEHKAKKKSAIQVAVEKYLDHDPEGNTDGFYDHLARKLKSTTEEILMHGQPYQYFFDRVSKIGSKKGVYLKHPKEGKQEGQPGWNHYNTSAISSRISRERENRNKS